MTLKPPPFNFQTKIPDGDDRLRQVCDTCGFINYVNPKIVVGAVATWGDEILLCKRAIEPRKGFWTLPAGFMEEGETVEAAAHREAREEACATLIIDGLLAIYSVPRISQVQIMFHARLATPDIAAGPESEAVRMVRYEDLAWADLAFPTVTWALRHFHAFQNGAPTPFSNPT
jgi:ADP-ribose pyrophosphatase YjhB (NUDIX family)